MNLKRVPAEKAELALGNQGRLLRLGQYCFWQMYLFVFQQEVRYG